MACLACVGSARVYSNNFFDGSPPLVCSGRDRGRGLGFCSIRKRRNINCSFNKWKWKWSRTPLYYSLGASTSLLEQEAKSLVTEINEENDGDMDMDVDVVLKSRPKPLQRAAISPTPTIKQGRPDLTNSAVTEIIEENDDEADMDVDVVLKSRPKPLQRAVISPTSTIQQERSDLVGDRWAPSAPHDKASDNGSGPKPLPRAAFPSTPNQKLKRSDLVGDRWVRSAPHDKADNNAAVIKSQHSKKYIPSSSVWKKGNPTSYEPRVSASAATTEISQGKQNLDELKFQGKENVDEGRTKKEKMVSMRTPVLSRPQPMRPKPILHGKPKPMTTPTNGAQVPAKKKVVLKDLGAAPKQKQVILKDVGSSIKPKPVNGSATVAGVFASPTPPKVGKPEGSGSPFNKKT